MLNVRCLLPTRAKEPVIGTKEKLYARKPRASKTSTSRNLRSNWAAQCAQRSFGFVWVRVGWWRKAVGEWGMNLILRTTLNCILSLSDYCGFGKVSVLVSVESVWLSVKVLGLDSAFIKLVYWCVFFFLTRRALLSSSGVLRFFGVVVSAHPSLVSLTNVHCSYNGRKWRDLKCTPLLRFIHSRSEYFWESGWKYLLCCWL